jgi:hydrophobe/amphiphile efflux-1 (HAE1) family protein/NodT family efflux transporter outer membrane factor (OMF) lipoprotein
MTQHTESDAREFFFVRRPTVAIVLSIVLTIFGLVTLKSLPISQYPNVVPPGVQINASYPGANAMAVEQSVTTPLEQQLNGVENMLYMRSVNANDGTTSIRVDFEVGTNLDMANVLVQNRVAQAQASLPDAVKRLGVTVKKSLSFPLLLVTLRSPNGSYDNSFLNNYATINIVDAIARINGVGQVTQFGGSDYAMRVWIKPDQLAKLGVTVNEVTQAISQQNVLAPAGQLGGAPAPPGTEFSYVMRTKDRLQSAEDFGKIVIKSDPTVGSLIRLRDVARIELGTQLYNSTARFNGASAAVLSIYQVPGSNALQVAQAVRKTLDDLSARFPEDIEYVVSLDTTKAVTAGIDEIVHTLRDAVILVVLVVFLFLQSWRATLIPILVVPVSLIATFAVFPLLGFSVNVLSLLGLVLAIGIVVDDAIVVVEAVMHHMEHGLSPRQATNKAMREVAGPVVAIALILCAVFVPVVFMGGISGLFYQQFAVTIAVSVLFSALGALTLTPALCAMLLRKSEPARGPLGALFRGFNSVFDRFTGVYVGTAGFVTRKLIRGVILFAVVVGGAFVCGRALPSGFIPEEDQGYILANMQLPDAASLERTTKGSKTVEQIILETPGVESVTTVDGFSLLTSSYSSNNTFFFIWLKPWDERPGLANSSFAIIRRLNARLASEFQQGVAMAFGPPAIPGLGNGSGFSMMLQDRGGNSPEYLEQNARAFVQAALKRPEVAGATTLYRASVPQLFADIDEEKAMAAGVSMADVNATLGTLLGGSYVNDFNRFGRLYKVYLQAEAEYRDQSEDLRTYYVRNKNGEMVSLGTLLATRPTSGPEFTNRFNLYRSAEVIGGSAPGYSSAQTLQALKQVAQEVLPPDMGYDWNAMSYQEERAAGTGAFVFALGMLFVFLILAAQYESWGLPFSVLLATPCAVFGALLGIVVCRQLSPGYLNNIFAQIGMLTLVGLSAKNAILIVEFARAKVAEGVPLLDAALEAAKLRFRPILMTAFAFILGVVPLVVAQGAGAMGRKVMGISVFSGMLMATVVGVVLVPMLFVLVERVSGRLRSGAKKDTSALLVLMLLASSVSGCLLKPEYERPVVLTEPSFRDGVVSDSSIANLPWWQLFKDPRLTALIETALNENRDLAIAMARIDEARATLGVVRPDQFPRLDLSGGATRSDVAEAVRPGVGPANDFSLLGRLGFEVDLWGRYASATEAARASLLSTEEAYKAVSLSLVAEVAVAYLQLLDFDRQLIISQRTLANRRKYTRLISERFAGGYTAKIDLNQAQIQEQEAAAAVVALQRARRITENALSVLLGHVPHEIARATPNTNPVSISEVPPGAPAELLTRRPDVRASEESARAAVMQVGVARSTQFPSLSLLGIIGLNSGQSTELFTSDGRTWSIGGNIAGPIIDLGKSWSRTEAAEAVAEQALKRYEGIVLQAVREVEDAMVSVRTFHEEHAIRQKQVEAALSADNLSMRRYTDGVASYLEVLSTQQSLFSAELARSNTQQRYLSSIVQLYKALGGGWERKPSS